MIKFARALVNSSSLPKDSVLTLLDGIVFLGDLKLMQFFVQKVPISSNKQNIGESLIKTAAKFGWDVMLPYGEKVSIISIYSLIIVIFDIQ
jgi:hypothetical protein